jgi:hypothetical protein
MLDEYYIGDIDAATIPATTKYTAPKQPHYNQDKTPEFVIKILQFLVPLVILGLAVAVRMYTTMTAPEIHLLQKRRLQEGNGAQAPSSP